MNTSTAITYSLRQSNPDSDEYFRAIESFTDAWLPKALARYRDYILSFRQFDPEPHKNLITDDEYFLEFLALSVMLHEQSSAASQIPLPLLHLMKGLVKIQNRYPKQSEFIKRLRGWIGGISRRLRSRTGPTYSLDRLMLFLQAVGEESFANRFKSWAAYFKTQDNKTISGDCFDLAEDFASASMTALGKYTAGIPEFLSHARHRYQWRYDSYFVSRTRLQYHLSMIGTEILNRAYRQRFIETEQKIVILPPCMKAQPDDRCQAVPTPFGAQCRGCTPSCRVNQITKIGKNENFSVFLIPEEIRVFQSPQEATNSVGVVGVSCLLTNLPGGWDAESLGIPVQGVPLDYVGCSYHWHPQGIPTDLNINQIRKILHGDQSGAHFIP